MNWQIFKGLMKLGGRISVAIRRKTNLFLLTRDGENTGGYKGRQEMKEKALKSMKADAGNK